ncbi:MAG TPA: [FeFe] hydrogenase H-cluster radical SAM maturase HydE [Phycisphaerae bacterium]|nr:[FeFe] hydrogenase H-cluster radical SAM maturase HydE [Phycisphaerae bacterium]HRY67927.1 [FeFe] hydrogenase H-cluster radical SAM maturase HydE [Phycisphaerae bacterium]HSA26664.1 [FeFe] hydrogenase H-cluster radical SAM maturase HydE [Phycisphaerae bacterium]
MEITRQHILQWLREDDPRRLAELWQQADQVRRDSVGDQVHLRGLVEFSNHCVRSCGYCGLRLGNEVIARYRMTADGILASAHQAVRFGYGTLVLQSGEDEETSTRWMASVVRRVKSETPLAVTLSLGERGRDDLACWREAGADRYLLRFETSNRELFDKIHPSLPGRHSDRIAILHQLRELGYEVGSGVMIGIPGQTYDDLANDIELFRQLRLDMIGVGPYLPHPATPLGQFGDRLAAPPGEQVPNSEEMTYKVVALARLVCPKANIPSTTALATVNKEEGRELGLQRGANVVMPNLTPLEYRRLYEIYPSKACIQERAEDCHHCLSHRIAAIGREVGSGRGDSASHRHRSTPADPG